MGYLKGSHVIQSCPTCALPLVINLRIWDPLFTSANPFTAASQVRFGWLTGRQDAMDHPENNNHNLAQIITKLLLKQFTNPEYKSSDQIRSVAQSCPTLCNPMNCSTPGLPVHHQLPEFTQTHIHRVSDAIQPSHPLSSPSLLAPNPSQHQRLFQ